MEIKAVAFDLDGTIYPSFMMNLCSIPSFLSHPVIIYNFGKIRKKIRNIRPIADFRKTQAQLLSESLRIPEDTVYKMIEKNLYGNWEKTFRIITPFPYVSGIIKELRDDGFKVAVLSDFPVESKLKHLGLNDVWDCAFSSEQTGYLKPNPEPFLALADKLSLKPEKIIYVGNNYKYDILGAKNVGMKTAHFAGRKVKDTKADITFFNYKTLKTYIYKQASSYNTQDKVKKIC